MSLPRKLGWRARSIEARVTVPSQGEYILAAEQRFATGISWWLWKVSHDHMVVARGTSRDERAARRSAKGALARQVRKCATAQKETT
jgi:hypothetical protein